MFKRFGGLIDAGTRGRSYLAVRVVSIVSSVEIEIMGTAADPGAVITHIRRLFEPVTELWCKVRTIQGAALRTAFPAKGMAGVVATELLSVTVLVMFTFGAFALHLILKMRDAEKMPPNLFRYRRRILVDPAGDL